MNCLVTGGSGYLGSALIKHLLSKSLNIKNFDIVNNENINVQFEKGDITNLERLLQITKNIDIVYHCVAKVPITKNKKDFKNVNLTGTENILKASLHNKVKKVVYISSSAVFGIPKKIPILEDDERKPIEAYGESKKDGENLCFEYMKKGLDITVIRPRTILGSDRLGIFSILFDWISEHKNVPVVNNGQNLYQFIDIRDLNEAIYKSSLLEGSNVFNIGAEKFSTIFNIINSCIIYSNSKSTIKNIDNNFLFKMANIISKTSLIPLQDYHFKVYGETVFFDITKSKKILNWSPKFSNTESIIDSYQNFIHKKNNHIFNKYNSPHNSLLKKGLLKYAHLFI
tara:strand:+ start:8405 stop:9427 length:1023 start_codon:yes stop_codon:yes gene_type:complete